MALKVKQPMMRVPPCDLHHPSPLPPCMQTHMCPSIHASTPSIHASMLAPIHLALPGACFCCHQRAVEGFHHRHLGRGHHICTHPPSNPCIHAHMHTLIHVHKCSVIFAHIHIHAHMPACIHAYMHTYMHTCTPAYIHTYLFAYLLGCCQRFLPPQGAHHWRQAKEGQVPQDKAMHLLLLLLLLLPLLLLATAAAPMHAYHLAQYTSTG